MPCDQMCHVQGEKDTSELDLDLGVERSVRIDRDPTPAERLAHLMPGKCTVTERVNWGVDTSLSNQVQLSVYPDCIGPEGKRDITAVAEFVSKCIGEVAGGVHVLPFYPSSADRGFAPLTHKEVNKDLGSWDDLQSIASKRDLCVDYMVNHISAQSKEFKDFVSKGDKVCSQHRQEQASSPLLGHKCAWHGQIRSSLLFSSHIRPQPMPCKHRLPFLQEQWCFIHMSPIHDASPTLPVEAPQR